jgi:triacylglycerol lipase
MDMGKLVDRPLERSSTCPRCSTSSTASSWAPRSPTPPVLIVQAVHDRIVSVDDIDELTDTYSRAAPR